MSLPDPELTVDGQPVARAKKPPLRQALQAELPWVLGLNTGIALFLTVLFFRGNGFWLNLLFSQCIGLTIYLLVAILARMLPAKLRWASWAFGVPLGFVVGLTLGAAVLDIPASALWFSMGRTWVQSLAVALVCSLVAGYFFWARERIAEERATAEHERARALLREKQALEAQLLALQAQIEPHFLFNTLANVVSLIERDGNLARRMLEDLIDFLRSSLVESRSRKTTVGRQAELLRSYLRILRIRMGARLRYRIEVAEQAEQAVLPPMLLQPLVENAIKHGIEPKVEGGEVSVAAVSAGDTLRITVADTGLGLGASQGGTGLGLANVRDRLVALYGERGRLEVTANQPCGVCVTLCLPLERL